MEKFGESKIERTRWRSISLSSSLHSSITTYNQTHPSIAIQRAFHPSVDPLLNCTLICTPSRFSSLPSLNLIPVDQARLRTRTHRIHQQSFSQHPPTSNMDMSQEDWDKSNFWATGNESAPPSDGLLNGELVAVGSNLDYTALDFPSNGEPSTNSKFDFELGPHESQDTSDLAPVETSNLINRGIGRCPRIAIFHA